jgi:predicted enzyme related to lactoylglutathione lyase
MSVGAVRSVYTVASDMDLMHAFYEGALELPLAFRDRDNWCQFKAGQIPFALSSRFEAAQGARGSVIVFDATDLAPFARRIERLGGRHLSSRDMGPHGSVATFADPENICFNCTSGPAASPAEPQQVDFNKDAPHEIRCFRSERPLRPSAGGAI